MSWFHLPEAQLLEVGGDGGVEFGGFGLLLAQLRHQPLHLLVERFAVLFLLGGADVAARREDVAVFADFLQGRALAEARYVAVNRDTLTLALSQWERVNRATLTPSPSPSGRGAGGEGVAVYRDIPGFCKSATLEEIRKHGYVLTPGRYVGAPEQEEDDEPSDQKMQRLVTQLREQQAEAAKLDAAIAANLKELGFWERKP